MGTRGPRPTPTPILELRGSKRARLNRDEPQPEAGIPEPPTWLEDEALQVWHQLLPQLDEMGVLTRIDGLALARYCTLWTHWVRATMFVNRHGTTYPLKDGNGRVKCFAQFPEVAIMHKLSLTLTRLEQEFGLTPSARARINVPIRPAPRHDEISVFFEGVDAWTEATTARKRDVDEASDAE
ncbi:MAG: phage terminase small subunit P27 family [Phycisphaeraceae bacterium]|nr:phage terminase small subunit P27 family [Phycisphaeraceae bacterium]MCW5763635.1 phage terminase small subunit P27 family [Phycisphaeraceae bacterium]